MGMIPICLKRKVSNPCERLAITYGCETGTLTKYLKKKKKKQKVIQKSLEWAMLGLIIRNKKVINMD